MQVLGIRRRLGKARVVIGHESGEQGVPRGQVARSGKPQLLDQAVLQGLVRPLNPTLRLARIGADNVDVESVERAPELGHAVAADRALVIDAAVRGPKHVVKIGKTPVLEGSQWRKLLQSIPDMTLRDMRDRALIATLTYSFARIGAALNM
jgi:hypothetical protein